MRGHQRQLRRPAVNVVGSNSSRGGAGGGAYDNDITNNKKWCKNDGRLMTYIEVIKNYKCLECGWVWVDEEKLKRLRRQEEEDQRLADLSKPHGPALGTLSGDLTRPGQRGTIRNTEEEDAALKFRPVVNAVTRRKDQLAREREKRRGLDYSEDVDMQRIQKRGGVITYSEQFVSSEGTYNSSEGYYYY